MPDKKTMTLKLSQQEMETIEELARRKDVSKTAIVKQAVRLLVLVESRTEEGGKLFLEDDKQKTELAVL
jgi:Ribbon-helix-helix protein, copG family.